MRTVSAIASCTLLAMAGLSAGAAEEGNVYVWLDKDGTPHYQDRPPEGVSTETARQLNLRYRLTDPQALAAAGKDKAASEDLVKLREGQQAEDKATAAAEREKLDKEREEGCTAAREKAQRYETAHRLYKPGPDGKRTYLNDEELDAARAEARRDVDEWCGQ